MLVVGKCATTPCGYEQGLHHLYLHLIDVGRNDILQCIC